MRLASLQSLPVNQELTILPVTSQLWADLEKLFGPNGAYSGCWCMWWRLSRSEFEHATREERKAAVRRLVMRYIIQGSSD